MLRMGADEQVLAVQAPVGEIGHQPRAQAVVVLLGDGVVYVAPPHVRLARWLANDELVLWRTTCVGPRADHERALRRDQPLALAHGRLVQGRRRQVRDDLAAADARAGTRRAGTWPVGGGRA